MVEAHTAIMKSCDQRLSYSSDSAACRQLAYIDIDIAATLRNPHATRFTARSHRALSIRQIGL